MTSSIAGAHATPCPRTAARANKAGALRFMGQEFATPWELRTAFPAYASDDCLRAIRAGCDTPLAVEQFCWMRNTITHNKAVANARASQYAARHVLGERDMAAKRRRGGQATAARGKAKPAGRKA